MARFSQYILESNGDFVLNEKLGNLNASNDPQYTFLLKAALKNKDWRGLIGPNSKIVTLTGSGRTQFIKDLRDVQKKIDDPQLIFLTTEFKTVMIKNADTGKYNDDSGTFSPNPVNANLYTADITVAHVPQWEKDKGPVLPKAEIDKCVTSAKNRTVQRRLKDSLDEAALDDDTKYHAVVILPDLENEAKAGQRFDNKFVDDKYAVGSRGTQFMQTARQNAEKLRSERSASSYNSRTMTFKDLYDILGDANERVIIDGALYVKSFYGKISGYGYNFTVTSSGIIRICDLRDSLNKYRLLTYDIKDQRFIIE